MRLLPGLCQVCRTPVVWNGSVWRNAKGRTVMGRHVCPEDRPTCNAVMRFGERCARLPGHTTEHRSAYAMANARRMRTGRAA